MNDDKIYIVRWTGALDKIQSVAFPKIAFPGLSSLEQAKLHAEHLLDDPCNTDIWILRAGRNLLTELWLKDPYSGKQPSNRRLLVQTGRFQMERSRSGELHTNDTAWVEPLGYVDGDADKHGPVVHVPLSEMPPARTDTEKAEWFRNNKIEERTCLWM